MRERFQSFALMKVLNDERIPAVVSVHDYKFVCPSYLLLDGKNNICEVCKGKHFFKAIQKKCVKDSYLFSLLKTRKRFENKTMK